jgi:hypothetical protein
MRGPAITGSPSISTNLRLLSDTFTSMCLDTYAWRLPNPFGADQEL